MRRLIVLVALLAPVAGFSKGSPVREVARLEQDILNGKLADRMTKGVEIALSRGAKELTARGYKLEADRMMMEWRTKHRRLFLNFATSTTDDIGEHPSVVLNEWLLEQYHVLELLLGISICKSLHLTAIKIFVTTPGVIFRPKTFPMDQVPGERIDEYRRHFVEGEIYYGGVSELTYLLVWGACSAGTSGLGAISMLCGLAGDVGERLFASFVGPKLSDWVYNNATGGLMSSSNDWDYWEGE